MIEWQLEDDIDWNSSSQFGNIDAPIFVCPSLQYWSFLGGGVGANIESAFDMTFDEVMGADFSISAQKTQRKRICCQ
jgi:hypothetical protein